jgi:crossover junction endodeoxyribonuclease RuvC
MYVKERQSIMSRGGFGTTQKLYLSMDTSMSKSGWAVLRVEDGSVSIVDYGLIRSNAKLTDGERLRQIHAGITDVLAKYPDVERVIPMEDGIVRFNTATKQIAKSRGVIEFSFADYEIADVNIQTVKAWARRVISADGKRKDKEMIAEAVRKYFGWSADKAFPSDDISDAIAVGIVYLTREELIDV